MKESNEIKSSAHSKYRCQYHIVFAPKYRRQAIYGSLKKDIGEILRKLCIQKGVEIIEAEACPDHIHMLVSVPPHISIAQFMGYIKGKSSLMIFDRMRMSLIDDIISTQEKGTVLYEGMTRLKSQLSEGWV